MLPGSSSHQRVSSEHHWYAIYRYTYGELARSQDICSSASMDDDCNDDGGDGQMCDRIFISAPPRVGPSQASVVHVRAIYPEL